VSKDKRTLPSVCGAIFTLPLLATTIIYMVQRYQAMVNFLDSNIQSLKKPDSLPLNSQLDFKIGEKQEETNFEFRLMLDIYDTDTFVRPVDWKKVGSFKIWLDTYIYDADSNTDFKEKIPLTYHSCTREDLEKWPKPNKYIGYAYEDYLCMDDGQDITLRHNSIFDYTKIEIIYDLCIGTDCYLP
jgi:hypothetical protein